MGSYTELTIAEYPLISSKSEVIPEAMTVFRETDRRTFARRLSERNPLVWGRLDDQDVETAIEYSCPTRHAIDRLDIMGFTLARARDNFEAGRQSELDKFSSWADDTNDSAWFADEWNLIKAITFDDYTNAFATVISAGLRPTPFDDHKQQGLDRFVKYILEHDSYNLGFLGNGDFRLLLRLACSVVGPETRVAQDITELIHAGYYSHDDRVCEDAIRSLTAGHLENAPRIILTEGSTDRAILKEALSILYPHLVEYYSFFDFKSSKAPGGAGHLVSLVKALAAAGIANRIVALFDNDTSARDATRLLTTLALPPNIVVMHYPELPLLCSYPTLGPSGLTMMNVNGLAGSIELYLGSDILRDDNQMLIPVQWKGYNESLQRYHGEIMRKTDLQRAYFRRAARCRATRTGRDEGDWSGLAAILQMVFKAFN